MDDAGLRPTPLPGSALVPAAYSSDGLVQPTQWALAWYRFRRHPLALAGAAVLGLMIVVALFGVHLSPVTPTVGDFYQGARPPMVPSHADYFHTNLPPQIWPFHWRFLLGTDPLAIPVLAYTIYGARPALEVGLGSALFSLLLRVVVGGLAGYLGPWVDIPLMRITDAFLTVPVLPLVMLVSLAMADHDVLLYVTVFSVAGWPAVARLTRSYCLTLREQEFVQAARGQGASDVGIIFRHVLPNASSALIVAFTLNAAMFVVAEANLDFLGAGPSVPTWGGALASAFYAGAIRNGYWWQIVFPTSALLATGLALNLLGDGLSDACDVTRPTSVREAAISARPAGRLAPPSALVTHIGDTARQVDGSRIRTWVAGRLVPHPLYAALLSLEGVASGRRGRWPRPLTWLALAAILLGVEAVLLYGHSPLEYSPYFTAPRREATVWSTGELSASPRQQGGWDLLGIDRQGRLLYQNVDPSGRVARQQIVSGAGSATDPVVAMDGSRVLGAWVSDQGEAIRAAYLGGRTVTPFAVNPPGGSVGSPSLVASPRGGFDVLFPWQRDRPAKGGVYLARLPPGVRSPASLRRLERTPGSALNPHGTIDGSGALDLVTVRRQGPGTWAAVFQRFPAGARSPTLSTVLDTIQYGPESIRGTVVQGAVPGEWSAALGRAPDGGVWIAWTGDDETAVAKWDAHGRLAVPPGAVGPGLGPQAVSLAVTPHGGIVFVSAPWNGGSTLEADGFDGRGRPAPPAGRVQYRPGDTAVDPQTGTQQDRPVVLWQEDLGNGDASVDTSAYHPYDAPDLATRLGLNIGNVWGNALLVVVGSVLGGIALTVLNAPLVAALVLAWVLAARSLSFMRWLAYDCAIALILAVVLGASLAPAALLMAGGLVGDPGASYRWLLVGAATTTSILAGRTLLVDREALLRAAVMAVAAVATVAVMYACLAIQFQLGRI